MEVLRKRRSTTTHLEHLKLFHARLLPKASDDKPMLDVSHVPGHHDSTSPLDTQGNAAPKQQLHLPALPKKSLPSTQGICSATHQLISLHPGADNATHEQALFNLGVALTRFNRTSRRLLNEKNKAASLAEPALARIFEFALDHENPYRIARINFEVTKVCFTWRQVALNHDKLWSNIVITGHSPLVCYKLILARTWPKPPEDNKPPPVPISLNICVDLHDCQEFFQEVTEEAIVVLVQPYFDRVLDFSAPPEVLSLLKGPPTRLQRLRCYDLVPGSYHPNIANTLTELTLTDLEDEMACQLLPPMPMLERLIVTCGIDVTVILAVIGTSPRLDSLEVCFVKLGDTPLAPLRQEVSCKLHTLILGFPYNQACRGKNLHTIIERLAFPANHELANITFAAFPTTSIGEDSFPYGKTIRKDGLLNALFSSLEHPTSLEIGNRDAFEHATYNYWMPVKLQGLDKSGQAQTRVLELPHPLTRSIDFFLKHAHYGNQSLREVWVPLHHWHPLVVSWGGVQMHRLTTVVLDLAWPNTRFDWRHLQLDVRPRVRAPNLDKIVFVNTYLTSSPPSNIPWASVKDALLNPLDLSGNGNGGRIRELELRDQVTFDGQECEDFNVVTNVPDRS